MPRRRRSLPQDIFLPGWRPGPIPHLAFPEPCLDFADSVITNHARGGGRFDRLQTRAWRQWFLERWAYTAAPDPSVSELLDLIELRTTLRALMEHQRAPRGVEIERLNSLLRASLRFWRLEGTAARGRRSLVLHLHPARAGWRAVMADIVASYARLAEAGRLGRVRRCANKNCALIFYDESVNGTRRWCDPRLCGNLVKVRQHRARERSRRGRGG
jgi:predicted RNA-binding Zn ribbon-like protein